MNEFFALFSVVFTLSFLSSCVNYSQHGNEYMHIIADAKINHDLKISSYNQCYLKPNFTKQENHSPLTLKEYERVLKRHLSDIGIVITQNKEDSNCVIEYKYSYGSNTTNVNMPIIGKTAVNSITTQYNTNSMFNGTSQSFGNTTRAKIYGYENGSSVSNFDYDYGITGYIPIERTNFYYKLELSAKTKTGKAMWESSTFIGDGLLDRREMFPYLSIVAASLARSDTGKFLYISLEKDIFDWTYYTYQKKLYRVNMYDEWEIFIEGDWCVLDRIEPYPIELTEKIQKKGKKVSYAYTKKQLEIEKKDNHGMQIVQ